MLQGIDISHWQEATPSLGGLDFLIARASYGTSPDGRYRQHIGAAKARGLVTGAYHFGRHGDVPGQVAAFIAAAGDVDLYVLDHEADGDDPAMTVAEAKAFIAGARAALKRPIGYYHSTSGYSDVGQDWRWVADYRDEPPIAWHLWQWQGSPLDRNHYRGTRAQLLALGGRKDTMGLHVTLPSAIVAGTLSMPKGCDAIRVADGEHYTVPVAVGRPAISASLTGGLAASGWLVDLNGDELHFVRTGPQLSFKPTIGADCQASVLAERERIKTAAKAALESIG